MRDFRRDKLTKTTTDLTTTNNPRRFELGRIRFLSPTKHPLPLTIHPRGARGGGPKGPEEAEAARRCAEDCAPARLFLSIIWPNIRSTRQDKAHCERGRARGGGEPGGAGCGARQTGQQGGRRERVSIAFEREWRYYQTIVGSPCLPPGAAGRTNSTSARHNTAAECRQAEGRRAGQGALPQGSPPRAHAHTHTTTPNTHSRTHYSTSTLATQKGLSERSAGSRFSSSMSSCHSPHLPQQAAACELSSSAKPVSEHLHS